MFVLFQKIINKNKTIQRKDIEDYRRSEMDYPFTLINQVLSQGKHEGLLNSISANQT